MSQSVEQFEPPQLTPVKFLLKVVAGLGTGFAANLVLLLLFVLTSSILQPILSADSYTSEINPLFVFTLIAIIFLTSLAGNIIGPLIFKAIQKEKYNRVSTAITHIFTLNILILALLIPLYIISITMGTGNLAASIAVLHLVLSVSASLIIFEVISNNLYSLVGIYSTIFAMLIGIGLNFIVFEATNGQWTVLLFAAMPILWLSISTTSAIIESLYRWIYSITGNDFLLTTANYGTDYGVQEPEETPQQQPQQKEEAGADFLRHKD